MKYKAIFDPTGANLVKYFDTITDAASWLDSINNNMETTTIIEEIKDGIPQGGYFHTEGTSYRGYKMIIK